MSVKVKTHIKFDHTSKCPGEYCGTAEQERKSLITNTNTVLRHSRVHCITTDQIPDHRPCTDARLHLKNLYDKNATSLLY